MRQPLTTFSDCRTAPWPRSLLG